VDQGYRGAASWPFLAALRRRHPARTILGSGDLFTAADAVRMIDETGVDGVWLARGAIGNPWIFQECGALWIDRGARLAPPSLSEQRAALIEHLELAAAILGPAQAASRLRHALLRYARFHPRPEDLRRAALVTRRIADIEALLATWYREGQAAGLPEEEVAAGRAG
jgi:tRNA-dihydrouridine synthase